MRCLRRPRSRPTWSRTSTPTTSSRSKTISRRCAKTSKISTWRAHFPPQHLPYDKGHGRLEERRIWTSPELLGYAEFPYSQQVFRIEHTVCHLDGSPRSQEVLVAEVLAVHDRLAVQCQHQRLAHLDVLEEGRLGRVEVERHEVEVELVEG